MAFVPLLQRPWGKKPRTPVWKIKTSAIWLVMICAFWTITFFLLTRLEPGDRGFAAMIGEIMGQCSGVLFVVGLIVIFTRPREKAD
jgi:hypothetical protein